MIYEVIVKPGSKEEAVDIVGEGALVVRIHARAHDGEANKALASLLAKHFKIAKGRIKIVRGLKSRHKIIEIA